MDEFFEAGQAGPLFEAGDCVADDSIVGTAHVRASNDNPIVFGPANNRQVSGLPAE